MIAIRHLFFMGAIVLLSGCRAKKDPQEYKSKRAGERQAKKMERLTSEYKPTLNKMGHDEVKKKVDQLLASNQERLALKYLERLIPMTEKDTEKERLILLAADLYFKQGDYEKAEEKYQLYERLFPAGSDVEKSAYSKTLCCFWRTLSADRDQTLTKQTIDYAKEFLTVQSFVDYRSEIQGIVDQCYQKLFEHEKDVIEQKLTKGTPESLRAANLRIAFIKDSLVAECPSLKQQYAELEKAYQPYASLAAPVQDLQQQTMLENQPVLQVAQKESKESTSGSKKRSYAELF